MSLWFRFDLSSLLIRFSILSRIYWPFLFLLLLTAHIYLLQFSTGFLISDQPVGTSWVLSSDAFPPRHPALTWCQPSLGPAPGPAPSPGLEPTWVTEHRPAAGSEVFPQPFSGLDIVQVKCANLRFPGKARHSPTPPSLGDSTYTSQRLAKIQACGGFSFLLFLGTFSFFNLTGHIFLMSEGL